MVVIHGTKKLLDRLKSPPHQGDEGSSTALGDWYATALFWRPQVALLVNESTLFPVLVPLAPAKTVVDRFVTALGTLLTALGARSRFVEAETRQMDQWRLAKTANRSVVGIMNEFAYLGEAYMQDHLSLLELSLRLSQTPCGPLYKRHGSPDRELAALLSELDSSSRDANNQERCSTIGTPSNDKQSLPVSSIFPTSSRSSLCANWPGGWV
jgi:hypothetical protein